MQRPSDFEFSRRRLLIAGAASLAAPAVARTVTPSAAKAEVPATGAPVMSKFSFNVNGKAREIEANPQVALLFHWPTIGRQVHITGIATVAERTLAVELFSERELSHRVQTLVSRQGTPISDLDPLRAQHAHLKATMETPPACPEDWGAIRVYPDTVELWSEAPDRLHDRWLYERGQRDWSVTRIAP